MGFQDLVYINPTTIILAIGNLLVLTLFLRHFLFKRVNKILEDRQKEVTDAFTEADEAKATARKLEADYQDKITLAKEESADIVQAATVKAQQRSDDIISQAKSEANALVTRANAEIEKEKKHAINEIKDEISSIAFSVAEKVIEKEVDKKDNDRLIEQFINSVGEIWKYDFQTQFSVN